MFSQVLQSLVPGDSVGHHVQVADGELLSLLQRLHDEHLLLVCVRVPGDRAVRLAGMVDSVDHWKDSHFAVVTRKYFNIRIYSTKLGVPERQSICEKDSKIRFGFVFVKHASINLLFCTRTVS